MLTPVLAPLLSMQKKRSQPTRVMTPVLDRFPVALPLVTEESISSRQLKSTNTYEDASARPIFSRVAAHHTEEQTAMKRLAPLQLVLTRDTPSLTDMMLPDRTSAAEQQSPESSTMEEQPRRVSAKEIGQELAELRRLGRLAKDLDRQLDQLDETA